MAGSFTWPAAASASLDTPVPATLDFSQLPGASSAATGSRPPRRTPPPRPIIFLLIGADGCGKTTFLQKLTKLDPKEFHPPHHPYVISSKNPTSSHLSPQLHFYTNRLPWQTPTAQFGTEEEDQSFLHGYHKPESGSPLPPVGPEGSGQKYTSDRIETPRPPEPRDPDIIVVCYDISARSSLDSIPYLVASLPTPDGGPSNPSLPILLLGLKRDTRDSLSQEPKPTFITPSEGYAMAQNLGLSSYMECSALTGELINKVEEDLVGRGLRMWMMKKVDEEERKEDEGLWDGCTVV